jgi:hypothetical protein
MPMTLNLTAPDGSVRPVSVPLNWTDLTLAQLHRLIKEPDTPRLTILTDLNEQELASIHPPDLLYFSNCLDFLSDRELLRDHLNLLLLTYKV